MKRIITFFSLCIFSLLLIACGKDAINEAKELINSGEYSGALDKLSDIESEEAKNLIEECNNHLLVEEAKKLISEGNYSEAVEKLSGIDTDDAQELLMECQNNIAYEEAVSFFENKQYEDAVSIFENISNIKDSNDCLVKAYTVLAENALKNENYEDAVSFYSKAGEEEKAEAYSKYIDAMELYEKGQFEEAAIIFVDISGIEESERLYSECQKNILSDYSFINALRDSVLDRMKKANEGNIATDILIKTELVSLEKYENADFYDEHLKELAQQYISGLRIQLEGISSIEKWIQYEKMTEGRIKREEVLTDLYENYEFEKDNSEFIASYILDLPEAKKELNAFKEIDADIGTQINNQVLDVEYLSPYNIGIILHNNTKYTYDCEVEFWFYDGNNVLLCNGYDVVTNIKPDSDMLFNIYLQTGIENVATYECRTFEYNIISPNE